MALRIPFNSILPRSNTGTKPQTKNLFCKNLFFVLLASFFSRLLGLTSFVALSKSTVKGDLKKNHRFPGFFPFNKMLVCLLQQTKPEEEALVEYSKAERMVISFLRTFCPPLSALPRPLYLNLPCSPVTESQPL